METDQKTANDTDEKTVDNTDEKSNPSKSSNNIFDNKHAFRIIIILLLAGIISGIRNLLKEKVHGKAIVEEIGVESWSYHIISALIAACLVPLFLHFIHSDLVLIDKTNENNIRNNMKAFILFGFCLIAGSFSDNFIEGVYSNSIQNEISDLIEENNKEKDLLLTDLINKRNNPNPPSDIEKGNYLEYLENDFRLEKDEARTVLEIKARTPIAKEDLLRIYVDSTIQIEPLLERMIKQRVFVEINLERPTIVTMDNFEGN